MTRTTPKAVQAIAQWDGTTDVHPFIDTASALVDEVESCDVNNLLDENKLELIERWLSAHIYHLKDELLASKNTSKAGGTFKGTTGMGLDTTQYGQMAKRLDVTGKLDELDSPGHIVTVDWMGENERDD